MIAGATDNLQQAGNINIDPMLNDLLHLIKSSPCIDKGMATAPSLPTVDIDGNPKSISGTVDIGAAEYTGAEIMIVGEGNTVTSYASLQDAYNHAAEGDIIKVPATVLSEDLLFNANVGITILGGFDYKYAQNPGMTTVNGSITIPTAPWAAAGSHLNKSHCGAPAYVSPWYFALKCALPLACFYSRRVLWESFF